MSDDEEFFRRRQPGGDGGLFGQRSVREGIDNLGRARRHAGISHDNRTRGRPQRLEKSIRDIGSTLDQLGVRGGNEFKNIAKMINSLGEGVEKGRDDIKDLSDLLDSNRDGIVSDAEVRAARVNEELLSEVKQIHPLLARSLRDPSFRIRQIEKSVVRPEQSGKVSNQVNLVKQGYAGYSSDLNMFNVDYVR